MTKPLIELLGIQYPIIQGGMARISDSTLVSAVSEAGGFGVLTSVGYTKEELRQEIRRVKLLTNRPFGVNLMLQQDNIPELVEVILTEKVTAVTTGAGSPKAFAAELQAAGIKVIPVVSQVKHAVKMVKLGVDAIIAEGYEAGGHVGLTATLPLVQQLRKEVELPIIAAGGIGSGEAILAMEALGAIGVQIGTLFLTAEECALGQRYKQALIDADDVATALTGLSWGLPVRNIANELIQDCLREEFAGVNYEAIRPMLYESYVRAVERDDVERGSVMTGQIAGIIDRIQPAATIIEALMASYHEAKERI